MTLPAIPGRWITGLTRWSAEVPADATAPLCPCPTLSGLVGVVLAYLGFDGPPVVGWEPAESAMDCPSCGMPIAAGAEVAVLLCGERTCEECIDYG